MVFNVLDLIRDLLSIAAFLIAGYALAVFVLDLYKTAVWQLQIALVLGFFLLVASVIAFAPLEPSAGFVLGVALALLFKYFPKEENKAEDDK